MKTEALEKLSKESVEDLARTLAEHQVNQQKSEAYGQGSSNAKAREENEAKWKRMLAQVTAMKKLQSGLLKTIETIPDGAVREILYSEAARELAEILKSEKKPDRLANKTEEDEDSAKKVEEGSEGNKKAPVKTEEVKMEPEGENAKKETRGATRKGWTRPASQRSISSYFHKGKNLYKS